MGTKLQPLNIHHIVYNECHHIVYNECKEILNTHDIATGRNDQLQLYFAVPHWIAEDFKKQSFEGLQEKRYKISHRVDQHVLKIESDQIQRLKDLFLETENTLEQSFVNRVEVTGHFRKRRRMELSDLK